MRKTQVVKPSQKLFRLKEKEKSYIVKLMANTTPKAIISCLCHKNTVENHQYENKPCVVHRRIKRVYL